MKGELTWQRVEIPFGAGLNQRTDDRARPQPFLDVCRDVQFDELGGLQTRLPFGNAAGSIFGGGAIANARRIVPYGNELVLFTSDSVYSWNAQQSAFVRRGTHLAVAVDETPRLATTGDQIDGDRAELNGTIVVVWTEGTQVFAAAIDKSTESVLVTPTAVSTAVGRPRLVALLTKILLFTDAGGNSLTARAIDPAAPGTAITGAGTQVSAAFNACYDAVPVPSVDTALIAIRLVGDASYSVKKVTAALALTAVQPVRVCDGPIAISIDPNGTNIQIVRANGANIQGDLLNASTLADVFTAQAVGTATGTPVNQIAAAHRSVQNGGAFRCYAFWSAQETTVSCTWLSKTNWVDTLGVLGTQANFVRHLGVASRAFDYNGSVYVWLVFGGTTTVNATGTFTIPPLALQNTYFLYRDDAFLSAKAIAGQGGGLAPTTGHLSGVALTSGSTGYSWCGTKRRRFALSAGGVGFAQREPVDVSFTFDSNTARRCAALGNTLFIAAGEILQYDGATLTELGFHIYPWLLSIIDAAAGGTVAVGRYAYKATLRSVNGKGESERSTTATIGEITVTGNSVSFPSPLAPLTATHKTSSPPAFEIWRTAIAPSTEAPFFLATSQDPTALTNPNRYMPNDPTLGSLPTFNDFLADSSLILNEANPENGPDLENTAPPAASIIIATDTRLFLAGVAGDPHRVWYSKQRNNGEVPAFHETLTIDVPRDGGRITSIAFLEEVLFVFRQTAIYALPGQGFDNAGGGQNFGPARILSLDVGAVNHESVARTPQGLIFKSSKGWHLLSGAGGIEYIGGRVVDFDSESVLAVTVVEAQQHVRILTSARMLVWDYNANQWGEWTISDGVHACMFGGAHVYLAATGTRTQLTTYTGVTYGADVETTWIKPGGLLQGAARINKFGLIGEYRGDHALRLRTAYDYQQDSAGNTIYTDATFWTPSPKVISGPLQVERGLSRGRCQALKIRITACSPAKDGTPATTEAIKLTNLAFKIGIRETFNRRLPAAQKT